MPPAGGNYLPLGNPMSDITGNRMLQVQDNWQEIIFFVKFLPKMGQSFLASKVFSTSQVYTNRVPRVRCDNEGSPGWTWRKQIGMTEYISDWCWWKPVGLESNFEVCSPFPCQLLHPVELLLLLHGQVDLLVRVAVQVEQVQLTLLKSQRWRVNFDDILWIYQALKVMTTILNSA